MRVEIIRRISGDTVNVLVSEPWNVNCTTGYSRVRTTPGELRGRKATQHTFMPTDKHI